MLPRFAELPVRPGAPPGSSWGVFGDDDEIGTLNFIRPEHVAAAASLVRRGKVFSLNLGLEVLDPPLFGRKPIRHTPSRNTAVRRSTTTSTTCTRRPRRSGTGSATSPTPSTASTTGRSSRS